MQAAGAIAVILVGLENKERFSEVMQIAQGRLQLPVNACARLSINENIIAREVVPVYLDTHTKNGYTGTTWTSSS